MESKPLYTSVAFATALLYAIAFLAEKLLEKELPTIVWLLIPVYAILTILLFRMISKASHKNSMRFVTSVYASVLVKLMFSAIIVAVYLFFKYPGRTAFVLSVMGIYAVFTVVLIRALLPAVRTGGKTNSGQSL